MPAKSAGDDSGAAAFSKAHGGLRKAETSLIRAKDERALCEAKLAKLITAEAKRIEACHAATDLFDAALAKRKPEADTFLGTKLATLGTSRIGGQGITVDAADQKAQAAVALLFSNASVQAARTATSATRADASEGSVALGALFEDVSMGDAGKPE